MNVIAHYPDYALIEDSRGDLFIYDAGGTIREVH